MSNRCMASVIAVAAVVLGAYGPSVGMASQKTKPWTAPRTAWGHSDLQGTWTSNTVTGVPVERPASFGEREVLTDEEFIARQKSVVEAQEAESRAGGTGNGPAHWYEWWGRTSRMTSLVVDPKDGRIPWKSDEIRKQANRQSRPERTWEDLNMWVRCLTRGLPTSMIPTAYNNAYRILQTPGQVVIFYEILGATRIIPLDGRPHADGRIRQWMGDSRGHWDGQTLVVDVTNFSNKTDGTLQREGSYTGGGETLHIVERFTRVDAGTIKYEATVEDPAKYTKPWTLAVPLARDDSYRIFEYACHEGNYSVPNILRGNQAREAEDK